VNSKAKTPIILWENILSHSLDINNISIDSFRQIGADNNRFSTWCAIEPSSRYFKSLLYAHAENLDSRILQSKLSLNLKSDNKKMEMALDIILKT